MWAGHTVRSQYQAFMLQNLHLKLVTLDRILLLWISKVYHRAYLCPPFNTIFSSPHNSTYFSKARFNASILIASVSQVIPFREIFRPVYRMLCDANRDSLFNHFKNNLFGKEYKLCHCSWRNVPRFVVNILRLLR
jgi:hypothetical protein